ncbi:transglycosylase domain-containing protein [Kribbella sp. NPDC058245]|uniref:transglycosylase domain-containing protein n=1 Tax=Kribbella sp. NPDC058245 TaxID=3346399 RepID=UPI0036E77E88
MSEARRKAAPPRRHKRHWALRVLGWLLALGFLGIIAGTAAFFIIYQQTEIPDVNKEFQANTSTVTWSNGVTMGTFYEQNRTSVPLRQIPKRVQDAVLAAEDRTFWTNPGISPQGMARAAFNIARGEQLQGGSTITQQYVKIMYLNQNRTATRKFKELFIATKLSRQQDKSKTLEGYLNTIYFGEGAYGISAAGQAYFQEPDPAKLTVQQAAFLATVLNNPTLFDIDKKSNHQRIIERYRYVLDGMKLSGTITEAQETQYAKALPKMNKPKKNNKYKGPSGFLLDMVKKELQRRGYSENDITGGGFKVVTTFDKDLQLKMVAAAETKVPKKKDNLHIGMASVRPGTGQLVAMYGGPDFLKSQLNWATSKARPGSSFKPFAVAAALKDNWDLTEDLQGDSPIRIQGQELNNEFNHDYGPVNLKYATQESINTAFYDLIDNQLGDDGPAKLVNAAEAAGIPKTTALENGRNNPSTVLGPDPYASPVDMANAYATFAAEGKQVELHTIKTITDHNGKVVFSDSSLKKNDAFDPEIARTVNNILQNVVDKGTGEGAQALDRPVAGKTGTAGGVAVEHRAADKKCDGCKAGTDTLTSWWTGYTPQLSTSVLYRAGKTGEGDLDPYSKDEAFFGGNWPLQTWLAYMKPALAAQDPTEFVEPQDDDGLKDPVPTKTPTSTPSSTPTNTPSGPTTTPTPTSTPTSTPTNTPSGPTKPTKPTKTPGWPTITPPGSDPGASEKPGGGGQ